MKKAISFKYFFMFTPLLFQNGDKPTLKMAPGTTIILFAHFCDDRTVAIS